MPQDSALKTYDRLTQGRVSHQLRTWRADGASYLDCVIRLRDEFEIRTTPPTVRRWLIELEQEAPAAS